MTSRRSLRLIHGTKDTPEALAERLLRAEACRRLDLEVEARMAKVDGPEVTGAFARDLLEWSRARLLELEAEVRREVRP